MIRVCYECDRRFDLTDEAEAEEWAYGHDCEDSTPERGFLCSPCLDLLDAKPDPGILIDTCDRCAKPGPVFSCRID